MYDQCNTCFPKFSWGKKSVKIIIENKQLMYSFSDVFLRSETLWSDICVCLTPTNLLISHAKSNETAFLNCSCLYKTLQQNRSDIQNQTGCNKRFLQCLNRKPLIISRLSFIGLEYCQWALFVMLPVPLLPHTAFGQRIPVKISFNGIS